MAEKISKKYASADLNEAWEMMHYALRAVIAEPDRRLAERGLTRMHHRILFFVSRESNLSVGTIQLRLGVSKQALNVPLRQLETQGLICNQKAAHDARVRQVTLTESGRALESMLTGLQHAMFAKAFTEAGEDAHQGWLKVMRAMRGA